MHDETLVSNSADRSGNRAVLSRPAPIGTPTSILRPCCRWRAFGARRVPYSIRQDGLIALVPRVLLVLAARERAG
eukprot:365920-Chlamydomonas_euryale.AAC.19